LRISIAFAGAAAAVVVASVELFSLGGHTLAAPQQASQPTTDTIVIPVTSTEYAFSPEDITVPAGQPIQFVITNIGAERHRFNVIGFDGRWRADNDEPGSTTTVEATFTLPGVYDVYCSSVTEVNHRAAGMVGTITVVAEGQGSSDM
jgi:plastocyanin